MREDTSWFVYIIRCENGSLYTGCTNHVINRWRDHCSGKGAKYLRSFPPEELVYVEEQPNQSEACKREYAIKKMRRAQKEALIESSNG